MAQRENVNFKLTTTSRLRIVKFADFSEKINSGGRITIKTISSGVTSS